MFLPQSTPRESILNYQILDNNIIIINRQAYKIWTYDEDHQLIIGELISKNIISSIMFPERRLIESPDFKIRYIRDVYGANFDSINFLKQLPITDERINKLFKKIKKSNTCSINLKDVKLFILTATHYYYRDDHNFAIFTISKKINNHHLIKKIWHNNKNLILKISADHLPLVNTIVSKPQEKMITLPNNMYDVYKTFIEYFVNLKIDERLFLEQNPGLFLYDLFLDEINFGSSKKVWIA